MSSSPKQRVDAVLCRARRRNRPQWNPLLLAVSFVVASVSITPTTTTHAQAGGFASQSVGEGRGAGEQGALFVARIATWIVPEAAYGPGGSSDLALASDSALLDVSVQSASGVRLAEPARGALRTHLRFTREGSLRAYVVLRVSRPTLVRFIFSPTPDDAIVADSAEPPAPRAELLAVGGSVSASAPRRAAARTDELVNAGFHASPVAVLMHVDSIPAPPSVDDCAFLVVAVDAGAIAMAGVELADGSDATLLMCRVHAPVAVVSTLGTPRVAFAWLAATVLADGADPWSHDIEPTALVLRQELGMRGFVRIASYDVIAAETDAATTLDVEVEAAACVAVAAVGRGGSLVDLRLTNGEGVFVGRSESRSPASRIYYCAEQAETLTAWVRAGASAEFAARLFVAREGP